MSKPWTRISNEVFPSDESTSFVTDTLKEAKLIVKCVNMHEELVAAAKLAIEVWPDQMRGSLLEAAVAKAEAE